ncbi:MAG: T9SS type A sorting domain-containing protein [Ignavibacteriales bacterium]|nr:T9SS type A sorting domain-containing protein [Ignavibacteriales bacterium]MCF8316709.1 T9SS type A sorting domain-containing protein [Ignavibacteriales bacterium]MCF8438333.1 T9SS type A sorting domain-containing protein [Ignavibacteriales bacterium]
MKKILLAIIITSCIYSQELQFYEDFSGSEIGSAFTTISGAWNIIEGELKGYWSQSAAQTDQGVIMLDTSLYNRNYFTASVRVKVRDGYWEGGERFVLRNSANNQILISFHTDFTNGINNMVIPHYRKNGETYKNIAVADSVSFFNTNIGDYNKFTIQKSGSTVRVFVNDIEATTFIDSVFGGDTYLGLATYGYAYYDEFKVEKFIAESIFFDEFGGSQINSAWTIVSGTWGIIEGELKGYWSQSSAQTDQGVIMLDTSLYDRNHYSATVRVKVRNGYWEGGERFVLRNSANNQILISFHTDYTTGINNMVIPHYRKNGETYKNIAFVDSVSFFNTNIGDYNKFTIQKNGSSIRVLVNDIEATTFIDSVFNGDTYLGLAAYGYAYYDDFEVKQSESYPVNYFIENFDGSLLDNYLWKIFDNTSFHEPGIDLVVNDTLIIHRGASNDNNGFYGVISQRTYPIVKDFSIDVFMSELHNWQDWKTDIKTPIAGIGYFNAGSYWELSYATTNGDIFNLIFAYQYVPDNKYSFRISNLNGLLSFEWDKGNGYELIHSTQDYSEVMLDFTSEYYQKILLITSDRGYTKYDNVVLNQSLISGIPKPYKTLNSFSLAQNYPNPFNPATKIQYSLPENTWVKLSVFNMLGEKVAELVNIEQSLGYHEAVFDASGFASGVYFYALEAQSSTGKANFREVRKMLLLK